MTLLGLSGGANGVILPSLGTFYHVGDAVLGLLFLVSSIGYFLSALSSGMLVERLGMRWMLGLGVVIILLGLLCFAFHLPFTLILCGRLCIGLGFGLLDTGFNVSVSAQSRSPVLLNYLHAFYGTGALLGPLMVTGILALLWSWNIVYVVLVVLSLLLFAGITLLMHEPSTVPIGTKEKKLAQGNLLGATLALPIVWLMAFFLLIYVGIETSLGSWAYSFLLEDRAQGTVIAGWIVSSYWFGLTLGRFVIQYQAERLRVSNAMLMFACILSLIVGLLGVWLIPIGAIAALGFCFIGFSLAPIFPLTVAIITRLVPARLGASAIGVLVSIATIGLAIFPWLAGILAQALGLWTLLPYSLVLAAVMLGLWAYLARPVDLSEARLLSEKSGVS